MTIRRLGPGDAPAFRQLRLGGLKESPTAFGSSHREEAGQPLAAFARRLVRSPDSWVLGAFAGSRLIGLIRLARETGRKERHKASIHSMYVAPRWRRAGVGRALLEAALATARRLRGVAQLRLAVVSVNLAAVALYRRVGFVEYGCEADALRSRGRSYAELLMALTL